ncbi:hypothetical protein ES703_18633 [subsurface metagenome]
MLKNNEILQYFMELFSKNLWGKSEFLMSEKRIFVLIHELLEKKRGLSADEIRT